MILSLELGRPLSYVMGTQYVHAKAFISRGMKRKRDSKLTFQGLKLRNSVQDVAVCKVAPHKQLLIHDLDKYSEMAFKGDILSSLSKEILCKRHLTT
jgi:hypothetical protein